MADWKENLFSAAMKVINNPTAQKIMSNESVQNAVGKTINAGFTVKERIEKGKKELAKQFGLSTEDDLRDIKREVDRLQRQVERLKEEAEEKESSKTSAAPESAGSEDSTSTDQHAN